MTTTMTRMTECTADAVLLLAFELGAETWKLGFIGGGRPRPRRRQIPAGATADLAREIASAKAWCGLPDSAPVRSCYEAGRDGFWLHRWLAAHTVGNVVVDSSSIQVNRRSRRAKTDALDLLDLLALLARHVSGEPRVWHVVRVPSVAEEDARHQSRRRESLQQERTRLRNRLTGLLATQGLRLPIRADFLTQLAGATLWDGSALPPGLQARLTQTYQQLTVATDQLATLDAAPGPAAEGLAAQWAMRLQTLKGVGPIGAWCLSTELFAWRAIRNGRELGALVGLVPSPYQSGATQHEQGISRAGNRHVRRMMVQLAWGWVRYQPTSALTRWYRARFQDSRRARRIGIVALARKLLIALWRYGATGLVPAGAEEKSAVA